MHKSRKLDGVVNQNESLCSSFACLPIVPWYSIITYKFERFKSKTYLSERVFVVGKAEISKLLGWKEWKVKPRFLIQICWQDRRGRRVILFFMSPLMASLQNNSSRGLGFAPCTPVSWWAGVRAKKERSSTCSQDQNGNNAVTKFHLLLVFESLMQRHQLHSATSFLGAFQKKSS